MHFRKLFLAFLLLAVSVALVAQTGSNAQTAPAQATKPTVRRVPASYTNPASGKEMYLAYCASCHGPDGKGNGPAAPALKTPPTDLTKLAAGNGGTFPANHVAEIIKGDRLTAAHGNKEMPVWGPVFQYLGQHDPGQ